jgi:hypothetical protein
MPAVNILTVGDPADYTEAQLDRACNIAFAMGAAQFILAEQPAGIDGIDLDNHPTSE